MARLHQAERLINMQSAIDSYIYAILVLVENSDDLITDYYLYLITQGRYNGDQSKQ